MNDKLRSDAKIHWFKWFLSIFAAVDATEYSAAEFVKKAEDSGRKLLIIFLVLVFWLCLIALAIKSYLFFSNNDTLFSVVAQTEKLEVTTFPSSVYPDWSLDAVKSEDCKGTEYVLTGTLTIKPQSKIHIERVGTQELYISIEGGEEQVVSEFRSLKEGTSVFKECLFMKFSDPSALPLSFPVDGIVRLGGQIKEGVNPMPLLLSGQVKIADKAAVSNEYYTAEPYELTIGDVFSIEQPTTQSSGFIYVNEEPGFTVSYNGKGKAGAIHRYKSEPISLENSIWTKLFNDETLIILWIFLGALYTCIKIVIRLCFSD